MSGTGCLVMVWCTVPISNIQFFSFLVFHSSQRKGSFHQRITPHCTGNINILKVRKPFFILHIPIFPFFMFASVFFLFVYILCMFRAGSMDWLDPTATAKPPYSGNLGCIVLCVFFTSFSWKIGTGRYLLSQYKFFFFLGCFHQISTVFF